METERGQESPMISKESQIKLWESLSGQWEDERATGEIIDDIYTARTMGRDINL